MLGERQRSQTLQQVHHCDMALDLALTLVYLEADISKQSEQF